MWAPSFSLLLLWQLGFGVAKTSQLSKERLELHSAGKIHSNLYQVSGVHSAKILMQPATEHVTNTIKLNKNNGRKLRRATPKEAAVPPPASMAQIDGTDAEIEATSAESASDRIATVTADVETEFLRGSQESSVEADEIAGSDLTKAAVTEKLELVDAKEHVEPSTKVEDNREEVQQVSTEDAVTEPSTEAEEATAETEEVSKEFVVAEPSTEIEETTEEIEEEVAVDSERASDEETQEVSANIREEDETHEPAKVHRVSRTTRALEKDTATKKNKNMGLAKETGSVEDAKNFQHAQKRGRSNLKVGQTKTKQTKDTIDRKYSKSDEGLAKEHQGLPELKAWTLMSRLYRHLHASVVAFQGGSPEVVALIAQSPPETTQPSTGQVFSSLLIWSFLSCLVAYFYTSRREKPGSADAEKQNDEVEVFQDWKHGLFSCHEDPELTMCACCCPGIRWALTLSYVPGMLPFWVAFFIYMCVELLGGLTAGTIGWVLLALLCTAYRQELRQKFNMERQGGMTYITDAMTYCFCVCCAIAQEARHVEDALKSGHPVLQDSEKMETTAPVTEAVVTGEEA